ncbi:hypothetical protein BDF20DRAFT_654068 [Mycotypha africana]|uniref:uncharacterized protein n=1 Tax=Mycotypha africana TaxID=64632 RepID=UPI0022FFE675|nr:uncharacterized protein BDF20DRAFT_654068 [Mycotypha africana]KAI8973464.1 hypothetical protein BDF20DRAFT_654068 [Mycotypha africana]
MKSRQKSKNNKLLGIVLSEEKFYFPGETIKGSVIVRPKKANMKINQIHIKFYGLISISAAEREIIRLFTKEQSISAKTVLKEAAKPYSFSFEFTVPDSIDLPSALDLGSRKLVGVHYKLVAILDRPMMPESLCPRIEYPVLVLEHIDITTPSRSAIAEKQKDYLNGQFTMKLNIPRSGYTRGETIPVNLIISTKSKFVKKDCLVIELLRKVRLRTNKNETDEEHVLKSNRFDLNIIGPYNFSQSITNRILIPSTPPTIKYKDTLLRIQYKVRVRLNTNDRMEKRSQSNPAAICTLDLPIILGTWPRADIPIDDDDDDDIIQTMGDLDFSDLEDEDEFQEDELDIVQEPIVRNIVLEEKRDSGSSCSKRENDISSKRYSHIGARRSESIGSTSSWKITTQQQQQTYQQYQPVSTAGTNFMYSCNNNSSRTSIASPSTLSIAATSVTTPTVTPSPMEKSSRNIPDHHCQPASASFHHQYQHHIINQPNRNNSLPSTHMNSITSDQLIMDENSGAYINKTILTPELQKHLQQPRSLSARGLEPTSRTSSLSHQRKLSTASSSGTGHRQQHHQRAGSMDSNNICSNPPVAEPDISVPSHTLTFISSTSTTTFDSPVYFGNSSSSLDSEFDDDEDDNDLLAIIEKKRKKEDREMRQKQRLMYTITN